MKYLLVVLLGLSTGLTAFAAPVNFMMDGQVMRVEPRFRVDRVITRQCWTEDVPVTQQSPSGRSYVGGAVGGVTGAVVGSRFGKGHGQDAMTVAGAIAGALIGDSIDNNGRTEPAQQYQTVPQQRCRDVPQETPVQEGYNVTVRFFQGQQETTFQMPNNPGGPGTPIRLNFTGNVTPVRW